MSDPPWCIRAETWTIGTQRKLSCVKQIIYENVAMVRGVSLREHKHNWAIRHVASVKPVDTYLAVVVFTCEKEEESKSQCNKCSVRQ